ncbi:hypothetical protein BW12_09720 [Bifidobacterium sp. UTCIF-3]|nr:hypothetical protein BW12_09720 [Bifidobacterium sp. UTCIF-3]
MTLHHVPQHHALHIRLQQGDSLRVRKLLDRRETSDNQVTFHSVLQQEPLLERVRLDTVVARIQCDRVDDIIRTHEFPEGIRQQFEIQGPPTKLRCYLIREHLGGGAADINRGLGVIHNTAQPRPPVTHLLQLIEKQVYAFAQALWMRRIKRFQHFISSGRSD